MPTITPHLWFDKEAREAAELYVSLFPGSRITRASTLRNTPSGDVDTVAFELAGRPFMAISAGPLFKINPSISFILSFDPSKDPRAGESLERTWSALEKGGQALMPLDQYPFSKRYGWIQDRYGLSWQLMLSSPTAEERPFITPSLMFTRDVAGRAAEAIDLYVSVFPGSRKGHAQPYGPGMEGERPESLAFADFNLAGGWFAAMDSAGPHAFTFNEAVSLLVPCDTQQEIDTCWQQLAADPADGQCGWIKDRFGVSWQIWPRRLGDMLQSREPERVKRVTEAFLRMKKFDLRKLESAFEGR